jgi:plasmid replication initiation protein
MSKTKQVVPTKDDYALQAHQISRAAYIMPVMQRRLVYVAMAQVRPGDPRSMDMEMSIGDIVRALSLGDSGKQYEEIRAAARGVMSQVLELEDDDGPQPSWTMLHWFEKARYIKSRDVLQLRLHSDLRPYVLEVQKQFSILSIADVAKLQGKYALRIFELVMSMSGNAGKNGNPPGKWWYEVEISHLRALFKIAPHEYKIMNNFRTWVIDKPIQEINDAEIGIRIFKVEYIRGSRNSIRAVRFLVEKVKRGEPKKIAPVTETETEDDWRVEHNPELFAALLRDEEKQADMFGGVSAMSRAIAQLRTHPDAKQPPKKGKK